MYSEGNTSDIRVLLVEDDDDDFVLVQDLFREIGNQRYKLQRVNSYESALETDLPETYDVCLLDYRLGARNGLELMVELRNRGYSCPMILLTGQTDKEIDQMAMKAGAADYLIKGQIDPQNLERAIRYSIQHRQFEDERINHIREQEARAQAEAANKAKDEFLAVLSHELRTPLNAMLGWVRLLKTNKGNDEIFAKAVETIERSAVTQTKFVEDLLDVTRITSGNIRLTMRSFSINDLVRSAINSARPSAEAKKIDLNAHEIDIDLVVFGDSERLLQVLNNLLSNALKFTDEGGNITVSLEKTGDTAKIMVKDTGQGISPEFLPYVFERYRQAHTSTTNRKGGLGLGLAIAKHLVELHGGTISAESGGDGHGSTFTVSVPLASSFVRATMAAPNEN